MTNHEPTTEYEALRSQRLGMLTAPGGSLSMVAMPAITTTPQTFRGLPGTWSCPDGTDVVSVTASREEHLHVDGHKLVGTSELSPESLLRFSESVTARVAREVDGTWFLQVADSDSPNLAAFASLERYDIDPGWVIKATYQSRATDNRVTLAGRLGSEQTHQRNSPGDLTMTLGGREHHLAVYATFMPNWVTVNFTDKTSGAQTPSAGRILALPQPADGPIMLDFNQAMLLPHESSPVYPCPIPPAGNHLPVEVTAGERAVHFNR